VGKIVIFASLLLALLGGCAQKVVEQPKLQDIEVTQTPRGVLLTISERLLFDSGKSEVKPEADEALSKVAEIIKMKTERNVSIEGHTDNSGKPDKNLKLSVDRAEAVKKILVAKGAPVERLVTKGYGASDPKADNKSESGKKLNRRTEIYLLGEDKITPEVEVGVFDGALTKLKNLFD